ncbi:MAG TPA: hypothetical protein VNI78_10600, partial [Vicinamibacterales bacterium]|nr:hypothetical protein [Vicinamibacterales bacterium]
TAGRPGLLWPPLGWMAAVSLGGWLASMAAAGSDINPEALLGMLGPLAAASGTWIAVVRAHAAAPERVTAVLVRGLAVKMVFFGTYVVVMLRGLALRPAPFVVSFTGFFLALLVMEAAFIRRLSTDV